MTKKVLFRVFVSLFFISHTIYVYSEGSKELNPFVSGNNPDVILYLCNDFSGQCNPWPYNGARTQFAIYGCADYERLYFQTLNSDEIVYFGFKANTNISFQIRQDIAGTPVVFAQQAMPGTTQTGYISNLPIANIGPVQIPGNTGGYTALTFSPGQAGKFFIEFNRSITTNFNITLFDVTVYNPLTGEEKPGRLYSQAWQFSRNENDDTYTGTNYVYTNDSIITSTEFSELIGGVWVQFCNISGCGPITGNNFAETQKSVLGANAYYPQYKIFLNPPDPDVDLFPPATVLGSIITTPPNEPYGVPFCNGHIIFHFKVNKAGSAEVQLSFPPPYLDVKVPGNVISGWNEIDWDGNDGSPVPVPVPNNVPVSISISYLNGLTNLPLFDVETNTNGFKVSLVAPAGANPEIYYNDVNINGSALQTCLPSTSCHSWGNNVGNLNTMNTWWYSSSSSTAVPTINHWKSPGLLSFTGNYPSVCTDSDIPVSVAPEQNTEQYVWEYTGTGGTFIPSATTAVPNVTLHLAANATAGNIKVYGTNTNCAIVPGPPSYQPITIKPAPDANATPASPLVVCNDALAVIDLASTIPGTIGSTTFNWTATAADPTKITPAILAGATNGPLSFTFHNSGDEPQNVNIEIIPVSNNCTGATVNYTITVNPTPSVGFNTPGNPPDPEVICSADNSSAITLASNVTTPAPAFSWTVTCNPLNISNCPPDGNGTIIPVANPVNLTAFAQDIVYSITASIPASGNQVCYGPPATATIRVNPKPALGNLTLSHQVCSGLQTGPVALVDYPPGIGVTFNWTATPSNPAVTGFVPGATGSLEIPVQTILNPLPTREYVDYSITPELGSGSPCLGDVVNYRIWVNPVPKPVVSGPLQVCYDQSGSVYNTPPAVNNQFIWDVTGEVSFSGDNTHEITVDWGPGPAGTIQLTQKDLNYPTSCAYTTTITNVVINPAPKPTITANPELPVSPCGNSTVIYSASAGIAPPNHAYTWTISGGTPATGSGSSITVNWDNDNPVAIDLLEEVTYAPGVICSAHALLFPVSLNLIPDPAGTIAGPPAVCQSPTITYTFDVPAIPNADGYTWWFDPPAGVTITNNGTFAVISFGMNAVSGNLYVKGTKTGCSAGPQSPAKYIRVNPPPVVALTACFDVITTQNAKPFLLKGGTPLGIGGKYYLDGVLQAGNLLNPAGLNPSLPHTIAFTYTDANGCEATATHPLTVRPSNAAFQCGTIFTDPRNIDPATNKYPTAPVTFSGMTTCWMLKNLNWGTTLASDQPQTDNCAVERYCETGDNTCTAYGALFQWDELMQYGSTPGWQKGVCPPGWHVPTSAEWQDLIDANQGNGLAAVFLQNGNFNALTRGIYYLNNVWAFTPADILNASMFWTSTLNGDKPLARGINQVNYSLSVYESSKANAFPVRCVKD